MEKFVTKGKEIAIEGKLHTGVMMTKCEKRYVTEVVVTEVLLLGK
jgi:single-strand DNA-binding protein